jgi:beta-galactosidase
MFWCGFHAQPMLANYAPLTPEQTTIVTNSSKRLVYSLAGDWQRWASGAEAEAKNVTLPYSETAIGEFHYRRTFVITQELINNREWHLYFLGSNYKTQVYVNGQYLQSHVGGSTPFYVRIPDQYLQSGNNTVELVVSNELDAQSSVPLRRSPHQAKVYGGVFRELFLIGTSDVFFSSLETRTALQPDLSSGTIQITATITSGKLKNLLLAAGDSSAATKNATQLKTAIEITAELRSSESDSASLFRAVPAQLEILANRTIQVKLSIPFSALKTWSPTFPNLYTFVAHIRHNGAVIDDYMCPIGLYNVQTGIVEDKQTLVFNGEPTVFKAVDYIEDSEVNRQTLSMAEYEKDIIAMKTLGANIVRVRYNTPHPYFVYLCDKYGLLVLTELSINGVPSEILGKDNYIVTAQLIVKEMIQAYENHPSALAWGISEAATEGSAELALYSQRLREVVRPNSAKLLYKTVLSGASLVDIEGFDFVVFAMNQDGQAFRAEAERLQSLATKTITVFSFGKIINPDNHNGYSDPLSVESQAKLFRTCFRLLQEHKISSNVIITSFNDYEAERSLLNVDNANQGIVTSGLVSRTRDVRVAYQMVKALFNDEKEPVLETGNYQPESPSFYTIVSIVLLITFFALANSNRRFREDVIRALLRPYNFYTDIRDQRILSNAGTFTLALLLSATLGLLLSSVLYFLRFSFLLDYILTHFISSETIKTFVNTVIWIPWASTLVGTGMFMVVIFVVTLLIRAGSLFVRARILMSDAFVISTWACLPMVFLLLMTMGLYKLLATNFYTQGALLLIVFVLVWCLYRMLRGTSVIYDVWSSRIYVIGVVLLFVVLGSVAVYYNTQYSTFAFTHYFFSVLFR